MEKLEGHTNKEIKKVLGYSLATIGRDLKLIRKIWKPELPR